MMLSNSKFGKVPVFYNLLKSLKFGILHNVNHGIGCIGSVYITISCYYICINVVIKCIHLVMYREEIHSSSLKYATSMNPIINTITSALQCL